MVVLSGLLISARHVSITKKQSSIDLEDFSVSDLLFTKLSSDLKTDIIQLNDSMKHLLSILETTLDLESFPVSDVHEIIHESLSHQY